MNWREWLTPKNAILGVLGILLVIFSRKIATILFPFLISLLLAAILEPFIQFLQTRCRLPRAAAVMTTLAGAVVISGYLLFNVVARTISQLVDLANLLPRYRETITDMTNDLFGQFEQLHESLPPIVGLNIQNSLEEFLRAIETGTRDLINRVLSMFAGLPVFVAVTMVIIVATYFISKDKDLIINLFMRMLPDKLRPRMNRAKERISVGLVGFIKARLLLLVIATSIAAVGLMLINTRYWTILAILIGILDNIPVIGPGIIFTPWVAVAVIMGDVDRAVYLTILYIIIFAFRQLVEPKIMGDSVGIHPLAMLLAMYAGIVLFGVMGIFLGPILVIIIKAALLAGVFSSEHNLSSE